MLKSILNLSGVQQLKKSEQKSIFGGLVPIEESPGEFLCSCNGHTLGFASSSSGCAAQCYGCISNGGCQPF
ncbi:MAG: hypothetical protein AB8B65_16345 [Kordia sp.]|uniref:hypothetical protein n=1 Tax=Kordia sp. TaxID=1965332 RepID=UPI00385CC631